MPVAEFDIVRWRNVTKTVAYWTKVCLYGDAI